jgi:hypothetical protein
MLSPVVEALKIVFLDRNRDPLAASFTVVSAPNLRAEYEATTPDQLIERLTSATIATDGSPKRWTSPRRQNFLRGGVAAIRHTCIACPLTKAHHSAPDYSRR